MEAKGFQSLQLSTRMKSEGLLKKPCDSSLRFAERQGIQILWPSRWQAQTAAPWHKPTALKVSCLSHNIPEQVLEPRNFSLSIDDTIFLKKKPKEIEPYLNGKCIYLVGMMGSGKTTVGRILAKALGYSFFDSDSLIEQNAGAATVAEIFNLYGESFFRDNETEILRKLSIMQRLVVSTGGGAVVRPINWQHMQKGITVWLDVPLDALARRITAVGTDSRPLLHRSSGDAYAKTLDRLSDLFEERSEEYAKANATVSLENIAAKMGYVDVCSLTPSIIAIEALKQIEKVLKK